MPSRVCSVAAACLAAAAAGAVRAAEPASPRILAKAGGSYDERVSDEARCRQITDAAPEADLPQSGSHASASGYAADLPTAIGGAIAFALIDLIDLSRARGKARVFCLSNLGYAPVPLTPRERAEYEGLIGARKEAWERAFLAQDLTERIAVLRAPQAPPLPPYRPEAGTQGGLRVDLPSLEAKTGLAEAGKVIATGRVFLWRQAELAAAFETTDGPIRVAGKAGTVFHQVDYRPQQSALLRDQGATWCGPVQETSQGGTSTQVYCLTPHPDGYDVFRPTGYVWLAGPYRDGVVLPRFAGPVVMTERAASEAPPMDLEIRVEGVGRSRVDLAAFVRRGERSVLLWRRSLPFDAAGQAVLPVWTRRVLLTRGEAKTVTARIDDLGDGRSWRQGDP